MLDFRARGFGFIPSRKSERELSLQEQLIDRLEERFRKHQASLRVLTVSGLAMALSACKDDALVQGSDGNDVLGNTPEDQIFRGRLGNDQDDQQIARRFVTSILVVQNTFAFQIFFC